MSCMRVNAPRADQSGASARPAPANPERGNHISCQTRTPVAFPAVINYCVVVLLACRGLHAALMLINIVTLSF